MIVLEGQVHSISCLSNSSSSCFTVRLKTNGNTMTHSCEQTGHSPKISFKFAKLMQIYLNLENKFISGHIKIHG